MPAGSFYWYDLETTGTDPVQDRILQFAGQRTDLNLQSTGEPDCFLIRPAEDIIPAPAAIALTGLSMQNLMEEGIADFTLAGRIQQLFSQAQTCVAGYNNLRFDDEFVRHALYRNLHDPYAREYLNGNCRWDLIDLLRMAYALRPEGIEWPMRHGVATMELSALADANGLKQGQAHDALSDVQVTISLARLARDRQPRLFDWYLKLRNKRFVLDQLRPYLLKPCVHVSGIHGASRHYLAVILPICDHPLNTNGVICLDLSADPRELLEAEADTIRRRVFTPRDQLTESRFNLITLHCNRCPAIAPLQVLRGSEQRLGLDMELLERHSRIVTEAGVEVQRRLLEALRQAFIPPEGAVSADPEDQLYTGPFFGDRDRQILKRLHAEGAGMLKPPLREVFDDPRLAELWFRARARLFRDDLSPEEAQRWQDLCRARLIRSGRLETFAGDMQRALCQGEEETAARLAELEVWVNDLVCRCGARLTSAVAPGSR